MCGGEAGQEGERVGGVARGPVLPALGRDRFSRWGITAGSFRAEEAEQERERESGEFAEEAGQGLLLRAENDPAPVTPLTLFPRTLPLTLFPEFFFSRARFSVHLRVSPSV
jgi:hypothetical protein